MKTELMNLIEKLEKIGVNTNGIHWLLAPGLHKGTAERALAKFFRKCGATKAGYKLERYCSSKRCYNPVHYHLVLDEGEPTEESLAEIEDLAMVIDLDDLQEMGFARYFLYFNQDNPLPAKKMDFYIACNRKLRKHKKPPLGEEVLGDEE